VSHRRMLPLMFVVIACLTLACGTHSASSSTIWEIEVTPNRANATSGSIPGDEVDFSVIAHYSDGHQASWSGSVEWSVDAGWVNLQNGKAICLQPAPPWFPLNIPTPAIITLELPLKAIVSVLPQNWPASERAAKLEPAQFPRRENGGTERCKIAAF
jgi:hypothetical protein